MDPNIIDPDVLKCITTAERAVEGGGSSARLRRILLDQIQLSIYSDGERDIHGNRLTDPPPLNVPSTQCIFDFLECTPLFDGLLLRGYRIIDDAVLDIFRDRLLRTGVKQVYLQSILGNEEILPLFHNLVISLKVYHHNNIAHGGQIMRLIDGNTVMEKLELLYNRNFGPDGALELGRGLARNNCLQDITIGQCSIGNDGVSNLVQAYTESDTTRTNACVIRLDLCYNGISDAIGGRNLGVLLQCFTSLQEFRLAGNPMGPLGCLALRPFLMSNTLVLTTLDLSDCNLGNQGLLNLVPTDESTNRSVINLYLRFNGIAGAVGGQALAVLLRGFVNVQELELWGNPLGAQGVHHLVIALHGRLFRRVVLQDCSLGNEGSAWSLLPATNAQISVTDLNIGQNWFQGDSAEVGESFPQDILSYFTNIRSLGLSSSYHLGSVWTHRVFIYLQQQHQLHQQRWRHVDISNCRLDDACIQTIAESLRISDNVVSLDLRNNELSLLGLESIKEMLWNCKNMDKLAICICKCSPNLQVLMQALVDCLSGDTTLQELILDDEEGDDGEVEDDEDWMQTLLLSGVEKNSSLHVFEGAKLGPANQLQLDCFLSRNKLITYAKSLDNAALAASRSAVVDALCEPCQNEDGTNASWMILLSHATSLFGIGSGTR